MNRACAAEESNPDRPGVPDLAGGRPCCRREADDVVVVEGSQAELGELVAF